MMKSNVNKYRIQIFFQDIFSHKNINIADIFGFLHFLLLLFKTF